MSAKYFHEAGGGHHDARFFRGPVAPGDARKILLRLLASFLEKVRPLGVRPILMHGALIGWFYNRSLLPWDDDIDLCVLHEELLAIEAAGGGAAFSCHRHCLDINPHHLSPETLNPSPRHHLEQNKIDARYIDRATGLFIDITALRPAADGCLVTKCPHRFPIPCLFPLRRSSLEGVGVFVPRDPEGVLKDEYGPDVLSRTAWADHVFDPVLGRWVESHRGVAPSAGGKRLPGGSFDAGWPEMKIPRRIHQSWKSHEVPEESYPAHWVESWKMMHPGWDYTLWTDEDNLALVRDHYPQYLAFYQALDAGIKRADFSRFLYLHRFGGLYVDLDFIALRNVGPLLAGASLVVGTLSEANRHYRIPNAFMASEPGHPFWTTIADDAVAAPEWERDVERLSGPLRLQWALDKYRPEGLRVLDQQMIYPFDWIHFTDWDGGVHYRAEEAELAKRLRTMSVAEMLPHFPRSHAVTTWNHNW